MSARLVALGAWRSLVAHLNGVQEVERSNRSAPTNRLNVKEPLGHSAGGLSLCSVPLLVPLLGRRGAREHGSLRLDSNAGGVRPVLFFETMVFGGSEGGRQERCPAWDVAREGHDRIVTELLRRN